MQSLDVCLVLIMEGGDRVRRAVKSNSRNRLVECRSQSLTNFSIACRLQRSIAEPLDTYWRIMALASAAVRCVLATAKVKWYSGSAALLEAEDRLK